MGNMRDKDEIQVIPATHALDGQPLEPEERPAQRVMSIPVSLSLGDTVISTTMPGEALLEMTAGEIAVGLRTTCATCRHFDQAGWRSIVKEWSVSSDMSKRRFIQECRAILAGSNDPNFVESHREQGADIPDVLASIDVEHALLDAGLCRALTEIFTKYATDPPDLKIVFPQSRCPDMDGPGGENLRLLYKPRDRRAGKAADAMYDAILKMALGEKPDAK